MTDDIQGIIDVMMAEISWLRRAYGSNGLEIYGTHELANQMMKVTVGDGGYVYEISLQDPTESKIMGVPFFPILAHGTEKPWRVVVVGGK